MNYKGKSYNGNNRKRTPGRTVSTATFPLPGKEVKKDLVRVDHKATIHLVSVCPRTGGKIYAKQGKATESNVSTVWKKGEVIPKGTYGMKTWIEQESTNLKITNYGL